MQSFNVKIRGDKQFAAFSRKKEALDNTVIVSAVEKNYQFDFAKESITIVFPDGHTFKGSILDLRFKLDGVVIDSSKLFFYKDKTGRGFTSKLTLVDILEAPDEEGYDEDTLHTWAKEASEGDTWESTSCIYTCIE